MAITNFNSIEKLIESWIEAEERGQQFPVPFDDAWRITGYKQKGHAKRKLLSRNAHLIQGEDYLTKSGKWSSNGRSSDLVKMTCDAFKHFCIIAQTLRSISSDYVPEENLETVYNLLKSESRQMLLGE